MKKKYVIQTVNVKKNCTDMLRVIPSPVIGATSIKKPHPALCGESLHLIRNSGASVLSSHMEVLVPERRGFDARPDNVEPQKA